MFPQLLSKVPLGRRHALYQTAIVTVGYTKLAKHIYLGHLTQLNKLQYMVEGSEQKLVHSMNDESSGWGLVDLSHLLQIKGTIPVNIGLIEHCFKLNQ